MAIWQPPEEAAPPAPEPEATKREYIVVLKKDVDYDAFWEQIENASDDDGFVPTRRVDIVNERPGSRRSCHYSLTDEEAEKLRNDPRIYGVEIPPDQRDDIQIGLHALQEGTWRKNSSVPLYNDQNWGLIRGANSADPWNTETSISGSYPYTLTGKGVDVVIQDSGVTPDHSEWLDENGESRYKSIDWYVESGLLTPGGTINLRTATTVNVTNKGSITMQRDYAPFYSTAFPPSYNTFASATSGASLHIGSNFYNNLNVVYGGTENGGKSYRIRFEGTTGNPANGGIGGTDTYTWEVTFTDSNAIQVLIVQHDFANYTDPSDDDRYGDQYGLNAGSQTSQYYVTYNVKQDIDRANLGTAASSFVFIPDDANGESWTAYTNDGDSNNNYSLQLVEGSWTLSNTLATEGGSSGLSTLGTGVGDPATPSSERFAAQLVPFNLPFDFFVTGPDISPQHPLHYRDINGHGSHCAGTVAGKTMGWAKDAHIYSVKVNGLESDSGNDNTTGISVNDCFDVIKLWHRNKPVDPKTGFKRPTVVNMSWGYGFSGSGSTLSSGVYRGTSWTSSDAGYTTNTEQWQSAGITPPLGFSRRVNARVASVDADLEELIDEGVHVCIAAGNSYYYIASEGDQDWDNTADFGYGQDFYHRGSSPYSTDAFIVGNIDITYQGGLEHKAESSCCGPGVDIYAPGTQILSVASQDYLGTNEIIIDGVIPCPAGTPGSTYRLMKISGTSMASPNVAGMIATILEANPGMTPAQMKTFIHNNATQNLLYNGVTDDWDDQDSIQGGPNRIFKTPFTSSVSIRASNVTLRKG